MNAVTERVTTQGFLYHFSDLHLPTCLPLWGRWQAERPDGEGACVPYFWGAGYMRKVATLSVTAPPGPCQRAAARPVAALTVHRTVIHYRDFASLTPKGRAKWVGERPVGIQESAKGRGGGTGRGRERAVPSLEGTARGSLLVTAFTAAAVAGTAVPGGTAYAGPAFFLGPAKIGDGTAQDRRQDGDGDRGLHKITAFLLRPGRSWSAGPP